MALMDVQNVPIDVHSLHGAVHSYLRQAAERHFGISTFF